ncbi:hypothetical protein V8C26DRAFT_416291 [Trichoderma gracile]
MDGRPGWCRSWRSFGSPETNWLAALSASLCLCLCSCFLRVLRACTGGLGDWRYPAAAIPPTTRPQDHVLRPHQRQDTNTQTHRDYRPEELQSRRPLPMLCTSEPYWGASHGCSGYQESPHRSIAC